MRFTFTAFYSLTLIVQVSSFLVSSTRSHDAPHTYTHTFGVGSTFNQQNLHSTLLEAMKSVETVMDVNATSVNDDPLPVPRPTIPPIPVNCKRLYLVRHGEVIPPGGKHGVLYGAIDVELSDLGKSEAIAAAEFLQDINLHQICSSPLSRAMYGASEVMRLQEKLFMREMLFKKMLIDEGFTELSRGEWAGKTREQIGQEKMQRFNECDLSVTPEGGESYPAVMKRVSAARDALLQATDVGRASCLVSHLQVTRCILR